MTSPSVPALHPQQDLTTFDDDPDLERANRNIAESGEQIEERVYVDTFSFIHEEEYVIPRTGGQTIKFMRMNEGKKSEFQRRTNQDIRIQRTTGDAKMRVDAASERHILIELSVTGWTLVRYNSHPGIERWEQVRFNEKSLAQWLANADPTIIQGLEKEIRSKNDWMVAEDSEEAIEEQITNLQERLERIREQKAKDETF